MFDGFARIIDGVTNRINKGWIRGFLIGAGVLNVVIASFVLVSPLFGAILAGIIVGISLLIVGIQIVTVGMMGRRQEQQINSQTRFGP